MIKRLSLRVWNSPTFMSWGSLLTRTFNIVFVLPLILTRFEAPEIALWYLLKSLFGLTTLADFGFSATFTRIISYSNSKFLQKFNSESLPTSEIEPEKAQTINSTMNVVYGRITLITTVVLIILGTLLLRRPISLTNLPNQSWISWIVVIFTSIFTIFGSKFATALQGLDEIALLKRYETVLSIAEILSLFTVLMLGGDLLGLVIVSQSWKLVYVFVNYRLCKHIRDGEYSRLSPWELDQNIFRTVWPSAWRSGLGRFMSYGLIQASGLIYAQIGTSGNLATYLLSLKLIQTISDFSRAPFYSKLPKMANLYVQKKYNEIVLLAKRGMSIAYWAFVIGFVGLGILGEPMLRLIESNASFASPTLWVLLGIGFFAERYGAMHIQLFSTTNQIKWHIANGVAGIIYLLVSIVFLSKIGVFAFPVALILGNVGFYSWYSASHSYRAFKMKFFAFELRTLFFPLLVFLAFTTFMLVANWVP